MILVAHHDPRPLHVPVNNSQTAAHVGYGIGVGCIVLGGLIAAVTGPMQLEKGSWLAAYLVLIGGVAMCVLSLQHHYIDVAAPTARRQWAVTGLWSLGNVLVVTGALTSNALLTDAGGIVLWVVLVIALLNSRGARRVWVAWALRALYVILIMSIPIGLILTHLRSA